MRPLAGLLGALLLAPLLAGCATPDERVETLDHGETDDTFAPVQGTSSFRFLGACVYTSLRNRSTCAGETLTRSGTFLVHANASGTELTATWTPISPAFRTMIVQLEMNGQLIAFSEGPSPLTFPLPILRAGQYEVYVRPAGSDAGDKEQRVEWVVAPGKK